MSLTGCTEWPRGEQLTIGLQSGSAAALHHGEVNYVSVSRRASDCAHISTHVTVTTVRTVRRAR